MSLNVCRSITPLLKNLVNSQHNCFIHTSLFRNSCSRSFYLCNSNKLDVRLYSTDTKNQLKHVYYGVLTPQIKAVKIFSLSSSVVGVIAQPFLYNGIVQSGSASVIAATYAFVGFFTVVTPLLLHFITRKYVTHLEYKEATDSYVASTINFLCMRKQTEFAVNEVVVPDIPGMFTTLLAKGRPLFMDPQFFDDPHHYARIMGLDKPMDFKLYQQPQKE
ncbi:unnamed protein product [Phyllotreta striolata]|uniref:Transmembrane protein 70 n=1 Tax=Phyllotreta striolata TaxID=444603 RepID=A0A9N9XKK2_PHYSR|nr:unnamed protein product [Phyllotreta striolata]